jgi:hypothetical protein
MRISIIGAADVAFLHLATGAGVALIALCVAAGPGRDFADGSADVLRVNGSPALRFVARVASVLIVVAACAAGMVCAILGGLYLSSVQEGFALRIDLGRHSDGHFVAAGAIVAAHICWIVLVAGKLRTQAAQLGAPLALVVLLLLVSRLSPVPLTPDAWIGPLLELKADRAGLDFLWSVGGSLGGPIVNILALATVSVSAGLYAIRLDRLPGSPAL